MTSSSAPSQPSGGSRAGGGLLSGRLYLERGELYGFSSPPRGAMGPLETVGDPKLREPLILE